MAFEGGVFLLWAEIDAHSSWLRCIRLNDVVQFWVFFEFSDTTKLAVSIDGMEYFVRFSIRPGVPYGINISTQEDVEKYKEQNVCASSVKKRTISDLGIHLIVLTVIIFVVQVFLLRV